MAGANTLELTDTNFESEVLQYSGAVLVDFWAPWCGPCKRLGPIVEAVAEAVAGKAKVGKVNVDDSPTLAAKYSVRAIPTTLFFRGGELVDQQVGFAEKDVLLQKLGV